MNTRNFDNLCAQIHDEMAQQIWMAGSDLDCEDIGWAFDRAVFTLELNAFVDEWTAADFVRESHLWDQYKVEVSQ